MALQERQNIVLQKLEDLNAAVTRAKTARISKETLYDELQAMRDGQASVDAFPAVLSNPTLQQLRAKLEELRQKESAVADDLGDRHPDLVKLRAEIASTDARLKAELAKVLDSVKNEFLAAQAEEESLVRALEAQKSDVLDLNRKGVAFAALQRQVAGDKEIYQKLLSESQTQTIVAKTAQTRIEVLESAEMPRAALGLPKFQQFALAICAALLLGLAAPIVRESLDQHVKTAPDLEKHLATRCLTMVPVADVGPSGSPGLVTAEATAFNEAFRRLRTSLLLHQSASGSTRLVVTSAAPREGKSLVASNLAVSLAHMNQRVLLVEGDLRRPQVHAIVGVPAFPGLADLLIGEAAVAEVIRPTGIPNLSVLPCGVKRAGTSELLSSTRLSVLLSQVDQTFDWIVFDSPPLGPVADACVIGQRCHLAVFVVSAGTTPVAGALAAMKQLETAKVTACRRGSEQGGSRAVCVLLRAVSDRRIRRVLHEAHGKRRAAAAGK